MLTVTGRGVRFGGRLRRRNDRPDAVAPDLRTAVPNPDRERLAAAVQVHGGGVPLVDGE